MRDYRVPRVVGKALMPFILLYALYIQLHGEYGPGGGFQAGVIFAAGFVLYSLIFGNDAARRVLPMGVLIRLIPIGVLLYLGVGVAGMLRGGAFLEYDVLRSDPVDGQHLGILLVEVGVGITVASTVVAIFYAMLGRGDRQ